MDPRLGPPGSSDGGGRLLYPPFSLDLRSAGVHAGAPKLATLCVSLGSTPWPGPLRRMRLRPARHAGAVSGMRDDSRSHRPDVNDQMKRRPFTLAAAVAA